jgi:prevent-host-death family protein
MSDINVTELRQNLPEYIKKVRSGTELRITVRGKVVARIVPEPNEGEAARGRLLALREKARIGDVMSPSGEEWDGKLDPA